MITGCADYMDDVVYMGMSRKGLREGSRVCCAYLREKFGIESKRTAGYIRMLTAEEETRHKSRGSPAARGCPAIDVAGYRIARTHVRMRRRNAKRTRRCFLRAGREYRETGTIRRQRAAQIISRNGIAMGADGDQFMRQYDVAGLVRVARRVMGHWGRIETKERKEILEDAVGKYRKHRAALCGEHGDRAGRGKVCAAG